MSANVISAGLSTHYCLVVAVAGPVHGVVHLVFDSGVGKLDVVGVSGIDSVVVEGFVLDERVKPAVADQNGLKADAVTFELPGINERVLLFNIPIVR